MPARTGGVCAAARRICPLTIHMCKIPPSERITVLSDRCQFRVTSNNKWTLQWFVLHAKLYAR